MSPLTLIATVSLLLSFCNAVPLLAERALMPVIDGERPPHETQVTHETTHTSSATATSQAQDTVGLLGLPLLPTATTTSATTPTTTSTTSSPTHKAETSTESHKSASKTPPTSSLATATSTSSMASATSTPASNKTTSGFGEMKQWKIIGIAVICVSFVGGVILLITFFDSWWGFLKAFFCGGRRRRSSELLIPDHDTRNWEFAIANEDEHRYPKMAVLEDVVKTQREQENRQPLASPNASPGNWTQPAFPPTMDMGELSPHPLAPVFRRPSFQSSSPMNPNGSTHA